jgi:hypothetical protein
MGSSARLPRQIQMRGLPRKFSNRARGLTILHRQINALQYGVNIVYEEPMLKLCVDNSGSRM